jgi:putative ABC transport system permease protein
MFSYYFNLGLRSLRRNPVLTTLMVMTLAVGVAASMSTLTVLRAMSGDPIPHKSERLFVVQVDNYPADTEEGEDPADHLSWLDAKELLRAGDGLRRSAMYAVGGVTELQDGSNQLVSGMAVTRDFFAMFEVPFRFGGGWSAEADTRGADEVVLSDAFSRRLFGETDPTGKTLRVMGRDRTIVGVLDAWQPLPKYYWLVGGSNRFGETDDVFVPLQNALVNELDPNGNVNCSGEGPEPGFNGLLNSECVFMQYWVELKSAAERDAFRQRLGAYIETQKSLGRLPVGERSRLLNVQEWMRAQRVLGDDTILQTLLATGFLLVCIVNTIGLLMAKFSGHAGEIGVRRALGATRRQLFQQYLVQAGVIGLAGGVLGVALTFAGLALIARQSEEVAAVAHMDATMLLLTLCAAVGAALLAGLLPTWRACQTLPAIQLKTQ